MWLPGTIVWGDIFVEFSGSDSQINMGLNGDVEGFLLISDLTALTPYIGLITCLQVRSAQISLHFNVKIVSTTAICLKYF